MRTLSRGKVQLRPTRSSSNPIPIGDEAKLGNVFEILEIEETNLRNHEDEEEQHDGRDSSDKENPWNRKPRKINKKKQTGKGKKAQKSKKSDTQVSIIKNPITDLDMFSPKTEYEIGEDEDEEFYFMIYCIFLDFNKIREWIQERWCDYQDGLCSLDQVSVATNTAFDILQRTEQLLLKENPRLEFGEMAMMLFVNGGLAHVDYEEQNRKRAAGETIEEDFFEESDWLGLDMYRFLSQWLENVPPGKIPTNRWHANDDGPNVPDYEFQSYKEKNNLEFGIIREFIAECCVIKALELRKTFCLPSHDELTRGTILMLHNRKIPMWLVFAFKIYSDIRLILESNVKQGQTDLLAVGKRNKRRLQGDSEYLKELGLPPNKFVEKRIAEIDCWITNDWAGADRSDLHIRHGDLEEQEPFFFFRRNPILCGLLSFSNALTMNEVGLNIANHWGAIIASTHLYNAIRQEILSFPIWEDMEALVLIHGQKRVFKDGIPKLPAEYSKSYDRSIGISAMIAQSRQHKATGSSEAIAAPECGLTPVSVVSWLYHSRYCYARKTLEYHPPTLPDVEKVLNYIAQNEMQLQLEGLRQLALPSTEVDTNKMRAIADRQQMSSSVNSSLTKQFQKSRALTSIQLLDALWARTSQETETLAFDYFSMHKRCTRLLRLVNKEFKEEIERMNDGEVEEDDGMLPVVSYFVFKMMEEEERRDEIVERVARVMKTLVEEEGSEEIREVRTTIMGLHSNN